MGEIGWVAWPDVDLDSGTVSLPGGVKGFARTISLTPWAVSAFRDHVSSAFEPFTGWVAVERAGGHDSRRSSVTAVVTEILKRAGLHGKPGVEPRSVAGWAGARLLADGQRIESVALALGLSSLDDTARLVGHDWKNPA